jgi:hypothetical protein
MKMSQKAVMRLESKLFDQSVVGVGLANQAAENKARLHDQGGHRCDVLRNIWPLTRKPLFVSAQPK